MDNRTRRVNLILRSFTMPDLSPEEREQLARDHETLWPFVLVVLFCVAFLSLAYATRPLWIDRWGL